MTVLADLKNKMIIRALIGFVLGMFIEIAFWFYNMRGYAPGFLLNLVMGGMVGLINNGSSVVYDIEKWGTTRATVFHYTLTVVVFLTIALSMGWFEVDATLAIFMVIFTVVYALIWLYEYLYWKKTVDKMNRQLDEFKKTERGSENE